MTGTGLRERIGEDNIFYADNRLFQSTELALARAWSLVRAGPPVSARPAAPGSEPVEALTSLTADDLVSRRFLRFGHQHAMREALWLLSELLKHTDATRPHPLFLQDRDGRFYGKITVDRILRELASAREDTEQSLPAESGPLQARLRSNFTSPIRNVAITGMPTLERDAGLVAVLAFFAENDFAVAPVVDGDGRLAGTIDAAAVLGALTEALDGPSGKEEA